MTAYLQSPDILVHPDYTQESRLKWLLENSQTVIQAIDSAAARQQWGELKYLGYLYLNVPVKRYFQGESGNNLHQSMFVEKHINNVATIFKDKIMYIVSAYSAYTNKQNLPTYLYPKNCPLPYLGPTGTELQLDQQIDVSHGGTLFYALRFLLGMEEGYFLEGSNAHCEEPALGIQVTPITNEAQRKNLAYKPYNYALRTISYLDYPIVLFAQIQTQYLDKAHLGYEAGLQTKNRSNLKNIRLEVIEKYENNSRIFEMSQKEKSFIYSKIDESIKYLESLGDPTPYRTELISALCSFTFIDTITWQSTQPLRIEPSQENSNNS